MGWATQDQQSAGFFSRENMPSLRPSCFSARMQAAAGQDRQDYMLAGSWLKAGAAAGPWDGLWKRRRASPHLPHACHLLSHTTLSPYNLATRGVADRPCVAHFAAHCLLLTVPCLLICCFLLIHLRPLLSPSHSLLAALFRSSYILL